VRGVLGKIGTSTKAAVWTLVSSVIYVGCLENVAEILLFFQLDSNCLRSWLEQDTSCPTCRLSLQDEKDNQTRQHNIGLQQQQQQQQQLVQQQQQQQQQQQLPLPPQELQAQQQQELRRMQTNFFHFDGSRYVSWLPSFSVEVTHNLGNNLPTFLRQNIDETQLNAWVRIGSYS
jgi:hypothetical protein